jgi:hypothetical protein
MYPITSPHCIHTHGGTLGLDLHLGETGPDANPGRVWMERGRALQALLSLYGSSACSHTYAAAGPSIAGQYAASRPGRPAVEALVLSHAPDAALFARLTETAIRQAIDPSHRIGYGDQGSVYRIPGIDGYVIKVLHGAMEEGLDLERARLVQDPFPEINVGQAVARLGRGVTLHVEVQGDPLPLIPLFGRNEQPAPADIRAHQLRYERQVDQLARLPRRAFEELAGCVSLLNARGYTIDFKAHNFLVDTKAQRINLVDVSPLGVPNTFTSVVFSLMNPTYADWYQGWPEEWAALPPAAARALFPVTSQAPLPAQTREGLQTIFQLMFGAACEADWPMLARGQERQLDGILRLAGIQPGTFVIA